jgi:CTP:molybdopterin cytidylyltransferase MocA
VISFRYHIITIVAIFLAVGLGLLVGNTVVQPSLVRDLERRTNYLSNSLADRWAEVGDLKARVGQLERAGNVLRQLDNGGLTGVPVVVVTHQGVDAGLLAETRAALDEAQADTVAVLTMSDRMAAVDDATRQRLATILGEPSDIDAATLQRRAAEILAERLAVGPPRRDVPPPPDDVLDKLLTDPDGFLTSPGITRDDLQRIGGRDEVVVVISGGQGDPAVQPKDFMVPLVEALAARGARVAAGESASTDYAFVGILRAVPADVLQPGTIVTVDDLDFPIGGAALVLGLERLLGSAEGGDYGIKEGATSSIPPRQ